MTFTGWLGRDWKGLFKLMTFQATTRNMLASEHEVSYWQGAKWPETIALILAFPFLLFPERYVFCTTFVLVLLASLWIAPLFLARRPLIPSTPMSAALLLFCCCLCLAILVTDDRELTLSKTTGLIFGFATWRYIVIAVRGRLQLNWAIGSYLIIGFCLTIVGLVGADWLLKAPSQVPLLGSILPAQFGSREFLAGVPGVHPNQIAGTITLFFPLLVAVMVEFYVADSALRKVALWVLLPALLLCSVALLLTQSRSGWVGIVGGVLSLVILWAIILKPSKKRRILRIAAALIVLLLLLLFVAAGPEQIERLWIEPPQETAVGSLSTLNLRRAIWPWALRGIEDFPLTGMGLGAFRQAARRLYPISIADDYDFAHAHNVVLQVALDVGLPGLVSYFAVLLVTAVTAWRIAKRGGLLRAYGIGLLSSLVAFHIFGLTDALALGSKSSALLWGIFGIVAAMANLWRPPTEIEEH